MRRAAGGCPRGGVRGFALAILGLSIFAQLGAASAFATVTDAPGQDAGEIRIGVLSVLEDEVTAGQWAPWAGRLEATLAGTRVRLRALTPQRMDAELRARTLDFVITNPGHYVLLESRHGATRIATQLTDAMTDPAHAVGSALVVRADSPVRTSAELRGRSVAAVAGDAFGGFRVMAAEWIGAGIDVEAGDVRMRFTGFPMTRVIDAVTAGEADAGILRACLLEHLEREGRVAPGRLRVIERREAPGGACAVSSPLYPGWALAAMPDVPAETARRVALAVLSMPEDASGSRWSVPADYQRVHEVLRTLEVEPYAFLRETRLDALARRYWYVLGGVLGLIALGALYTLRVEVLVQRRTRELTRSLEERRALARQHEEDREAMDHLSRLSILGELSATLGHELNQPLATISNYVASVQRRAQRQSLSPDALQRALDEMQAQVDRAVRVLDGIRTLARKRIGERRSLPPLGWVQEAITVFRGMQTNAPEVRLEAAGAVQTAAATVDAPQMQQVLLNLLKNAQDAHRGGGTPDAEIVCRVDLADGQLRIAVEDRGLPLTPEQRDHLFEPFFTTKPSGLGLGLPICRTIVEAHGGALRAHPVDPSGLIGGMTFEVWLPLSDSTTPPPEHETDPA